MLWMIETYCSSSFWWIWTLHEGSCASCFIKINDTIDELLDFCCRDTMEVQCGILHLLFKQSFLVDFLKNMGLHSKKYTCTWRIHRCLFTLYHKFYHLELVDNCLVLYLIFFVKVLEDCPGDLNYWYRHISKGAWPFSTADHGWPISDCTAEGLKVIMIRRLYFYLRFSLILTHSFQVAVLLSQIPPELVGEPIDTERLYDAVNVILSLQVCRLLMIPTLFFSKSWANEIL